MEVRGQFHPTSALSILAPTPDSRYLLQPLCSVYCFPCFSFWLSKCSIICGKCFPVAINSCLPPLTFCESGDQFSFFFISFLFTQGCSSPVVVKFADTQKDKDQKRNQQIHASILPGFQSQPASVNTLSPQYFTVSQNLHHHDSTHCPPCVPVS